MQEARFSLTAKLPVDGKSFEKMAIITKAFEACAAELKGVHMISSEIEHTIMTPRGAGDQPAATETAPVTRKKREKPTPAPGAVDAMGTGAKETERSAEPEAVKPSETSQEALDKARAATTGAGVSFKPADSAPAA